MAITGKKFSQLTESQQIATRVPITGWLVNNLFLNPISKTVELVLEESVAFDDGSIQLICYTPNPTITLGAQEVEIGFTMHIVNWFCPQTFIEPGVGFTILPYQQCKLNRAFGVFKIEKTDDTEWTVSVVENGTIIDNAIG